MNKLAKKGLKFEIKINGGEYKRTIILNYSSFLDFALLDWRDDGTVRVYLPYSSMPTLISHGEKTENLNLNFRCELDPLDKQILSAFEDNSVLVLALKFNSSDDDSYDLLQEVLKNPNYFPIGIYDSCVTVISDDQEEDLWDLFLKSSSTDIELNSLAWNLSAIKSQKNVAFSKATQRKVLKTILEAHNLESLILALNFYLFKGIDFPYWFNFDAALKMEFEAQKNLTKKVRNNTVLVGSVVITSTRTVYYPVMSVKQSRIHRKFPNNKFVIVAFRDENMDKLQGQESFKFVTYMLNNGLTLNGKRYNFFCGSASEQRSHKALFISSESIEEVNELRSMIVLNSQDLNSVSEFLSKLSLFCTTDTPTFNLFPERWAVADDVSAENGDCLTEGTGLIRSSVASQIAHLLESNSIPSAYQVRFSGIKGVLLVVDDQFMDNSVGCEKDILIRKSMIKFESNDYNLGIVSFSKFIPVKLNREVITLLESISPIVVEELHVLQEKELSRLVEMLLNSQIASKKLKCSLANVWNVKEVAKYFDMASEPFWIQILKKLFDSEVTDIAKKAKILVEEAALVIGVADPFQILCDEEIFLQVQRSEDEEAVTVTGLVAIYRNPCLYPGDVRTVMAVDRAEFRSFKNVLIMPASPNCKYSLAAACSGGDLDGDLFAVIWNSRLVPPVSCIYPPLRYSKLKCDIPKHPTPCKHQALSEFYVKSLVNDVLGRVAHLHLALCDRREGGACDPLAMKVAESQAVAVDFPKTGIAPTAGMG
ncbi:hypothetical protein QYM36_007131 [Artemia franciscana]|uniref:RNA-dependent RNA polymerase n=1 Tax=Artemia franciscana TaxID=6661 RepID=A0AA88LCY8_ARTSF|nr:hypothetical protein QYM36_007131 [Artemia franciscana]